MTARKWTPTGDAAIRAAACQRALLDCITSSGELASGTYSSMKMRLKGINHKVRAALNTPTEFLPERSLHDDGEALADAVEALMSAFGRSDGPDPSIQIARNRAKAALAKWRATAAKARGEG